MENNKNTLLPISVKNLYYRKGKRCLLKKVSCEISSSGITIILGPNGAGKSLFLKCLHGIINNNYFEINYAGVALNKEIRLKQSMVFQHPLLMRRSVINNLLFVINQRKIKMKKESLFNLLQKVDLLSLINEKAILLSGGQKQRLALARAIITSPKVLFLDEATSNLDPYSIQIIENLITEVNITGTKVIAVTHDLSQARRLADDVVFFNKGSICEHTSAENFFKIPKSNEGKLFIEGKIIL